MTDKEFKLIENLIVELKKHNVDKDSCGYITIRLSQLNKCAEMLTWLKIIVMLTKKKFLNTSIY